MLTKGSGPPSCRGGGGGTWGAMLEIWHKVLNGTSWPSLVKGHKLKFWNYYSGFQDMHINLGGSSPGGTESPVDVGEGY